MGQKINPVGFRLGVFKPWRHNWFLEKKTYSDFLHLNFEILKYFKGTFRNHNRRTLVLDYSVSKISFLTLYIFILFYRLRRKKKKFKKKQQKMLDENIEIKPSLLNPKHKRNYLTNKLIYANSVYENLFHANNYLKLDNLNNLNAILFFYKRIKKIENILFLTTNRRKQIISRRKYVNVSSIKKSLLALSNISFLYVILINTMSLLKFYEIFFKKPDKQRNFLLLERKLVRRYKSEVRLAKDTMYVLFITTLLKKAEFLAKFLGYQLKRMPKNRRQTKLFYYIKALLDFILITESEVKGLRIQFTGRINGRPRSKYVILNIGNLPLQTQSACLEYGQSFGITRYGVIGIKVWIHYEFSFVDLLYVCLMTYFEYGYLKKNVTT